MNMADPTFVIVSLFFLLLGVAARTFLSFAQKIYEGKLTWSDFLNRFYALASASFIAGAGFYLTMAPISTDLFKEVIITFLIGLAGNEIFNRVYHWVEIYTEKNGQ